MRLLISDVLDGRFNLRLPDGKRAVTAPPIKILEAFRLDPF